MKDNSIPKNLSSDKISGELILFHLIVYNGGGVQEYELHKCLSCGTRSFIRYARELEEIGALPRVHVSRNLGEMRLSCDLEGFVPSIKPDYDDHHLNRLSRLVCIAAEYYGLISNLFPDYHTLYMGKGARTLQRDKRTVFDALCWWASCEYEYDPNNDEDASWEFFEYLWYLENDYNLKTHLLPPGYNLDD